MKRLLTSLTCGLLLAVSCGGGATAAPSRAPAAATHAHDTTPATVSEPTVPAAAESTAPLPTSAATAPGASPAQIEAAPTATPDALAAKPLPAASSPTASPAKPLPTVAPAATAPAYVPQGKTTITATLTDAMRIVLSQSSAPAGTVTFNVKNTGTVAHDLIVLKTALAQNQIPVDPTQPALALEPGLIGQAANLAPGASTTLTLTLDAGSYVLMCNQPAHYIAGMHIAFTVTSPLALQMPQTLTRIA